MPDGSTLLVFSAAVLVLLVVPGPAVFYIVTRSMSEGRVAGLVSVLGINVGTLFHVAGAVLGLSAILATSVVAFRVVQYAGAAYLVYLGLQSFFSRTELHAPEQPERQELRRVFTQGVLVNLLNPKTALFFLAFLPQFVDVSRGSVTSQVLILSFVLIVMGLITDGLYAILAGRVGLWLRENLRFMRFQRYFAGTIYILLGLFAAWSGTGKK